MIGWVNSGRRTLLAALALFAVAAPSASLAAGLPKVAITTDHGVVVVAIDTQHAPLTANNFLRYVDAGKYDGGTFFRAARNPGSKTDGTLVGGTPPGSHPYPPIAHEPTTKTGLHHRDGTLSLGRFTAGSATSDIFICSGDQPYLDANPKAKGDNLGYAAFGQVVSGMGVVRKIMASPVGGHSPFPDQKGQWLTKPAKIISIKRVG